MDVYKRLKELGIEISEQVAPVGSYTPSLVSRGLLFLSGILPFKDGVLLCEGVVGKTVTLEEAQNAARQVVVNALSVIHNEVGLNKVRRCVRLNGFVASSAEFYEQPKVLNAASDLLKEVFGEAGIHTRIAVGVTVLPLNAPVEIDFIFELKD